jgi:poly-gamma-glutamate synthesis protein (capsule biosynthesis protein)
MPQQKQDVITLVGVGDIKHHRDDPPSIFRHCRSTFQKADIVFGQLESTYSEKGSPMFVPSAPSRRASKNITGLTEEGAGFDVMSFACNHAMDYGLEAFYDTLDLVKKNNITLVGAGRNIDEARKPAIVERHGTKVGFLANLSIIFPGLIAEEDTPGCVPLRATNFYQPVFKFQPGTAPLIVTELFPEDKAAMLNDIKKLRPQVDVLVVSMHCGVFMTPAIIAMYQKEAAYAAIDAGADLVLQHHAHILKGIEVYKGKGIFYGLGNFAVEPTPDTPDKLKAWDLAYRNIPEFFHFKKIPGWEKYPYHPDARMTMIAKAYIADKNIQQISYIPCYINQNAEPEVLTRKDPRAQEVFDYVKSISDYENLKVNFSWLGDEVLVNSKG